VPVAPAPHSAPLPVNHKVALTLTPSMSRPTIEDQLDTLRVLSIDEITGVSHQGPKFTAREPPKHSCVESIRQIASRLKVSGIDQSIQEVKALVDRNMNSTMQQVISSAANDTDESRKEWADSLTAILMCTLGPDLDDHTKSPKDNFYFLLNDALLRRDAVVKDRGEGRDFMYYLMKGLEALPPFSNESTVWRGVSAEGAVEVLQYYKLGSEVFWIGMSAAFLKPSVAVGYAGQGGLLLRICLQRKNSMARDLRPLSAVATEDQVDT